MPKVKQARSALDFVNDNPARPGILREVIYKHLNYKAIFCHKI